MTLHEVARVLFWEEKKPSELPYISDLKKLTTNKNKQNKAKEKFELKKLQYFFSGDKIVLKNLISQI